MIRYVGCSLLQSLSIPYPFPLHPIEEQPKLDDLNKWNDDSCDNLKMRENVFYNPMDGVGFCLYNPRFPPSYLSRSITRSS